MARRPALGRDLLEHGPLDPAALVGVGAAGVEVAARGRVDRRRDLALDRLVVARARLEAGDLLEQGPGVGVVGLTEELVGGRGLDHAAEVHDDDAVGDVLELPAP